MKRQLEPELRDYILAKIAALPSNDVADLGRPRHIAATNALAQRDPRALFILAMKSFVGIREVGGDNRGRLVQLLQSTVGDPEREAWCMSTVQSALAFVEVTLGVTSPIAVSEHCLTVWRQTPVAQRVKFAPLPGAICIWRHGSSDAGHTGATITPYVNRIGSLVEGNTTNGVGPHGEIIRNGGGCYETRRSQDGTGTMRVVGYLKPF